MQQLARFFSVNGADGQPHGVPLVITAGLHACNEPTAAVSKAPTMRTCVTKSKSNVALAIVIVEVEHKINTAMDAEVLSFAWYMIMFCSHVSITCTDAPSCQLCKLVAVVRCSKLRTYISESHFFRCFIPDSHI